MSALLFYETKRMLGSQKSELIESFAILGVLFMMFLLYLYSNLQHWCCITGFENGEHTVNIVGGCRGTCESPDTSHDLWARLQLGRRQRNRAWQHFHHLRGGGEQADRETGPYKQHYHRGCTRPKPSVCRHLNDQARAHWRNDSTFLLRNYFARWPFDHLKKQTCAQKCRANNKK